MNINDRKYHPLTTEEAQQIIVQGILDEIFIYAICTVKGYGAYCPLAPEDLEKIRIAPASMGAEILVSPAGRRTTGNFLDDHAYRRYVKLSELWISEDDYKKLLIPIKSQKQQEIKDSKWPENGEIAEMNADKALAVMAWLFSEKSTKHSISGRPNCEQIASAVQERAIQYFGSDNVQFKSFCKRLSSALKLLSGKTNTDQ